MKHPKNKNTIFRDRVLNNIGCLERAEHDLPVIATSNPAAQKWTCSKNVYTLKNLARDDRGHSWKVLMEKIAEPIEISNGRPRPLNIHRSSQGLNSGVPQVRSQRSTSE